MAISIYNSLTRKKEKFTPIKNGRIGIYVCGPTVYDEPHIGHARSSYIFDVVRNYFSFKGYKVKFVKNITDVDDKIIEKARTESGSQTDDDFKDLKSAAAKIAKRYLKLYYDEMDRLGIKRADFEPRATQYIQKMIRVAAGLIDKDFAYASDGDVYFDVRKFKGYGKLSGQSLDNMEAGARVHPGENKRYPLDFALWKSAKEDEPSWESPWGHGRPGWHIECSCMSMDILGANFDIHGGGLDLIFPHHENEIAQSECYNGRDFANYWMHNGLLTINGEKMAKSLGNFISIKDILKRYSPEALKLFFLSGHYRSPIDFTYDKMEEAKKARERFYMLSDRIDLAGKPAQKRPGISEIESRRVKFEEAMDDDFNTPLALGHLHEMVNTVNRMLDDNACDKGFLSYSKDTILNLGGIFGLFKDRREFTRRKALEDDIREAIEERNRARKRGDYETADRVRRELYDKGFVLEDTKEKTLWRRRI